MVSLISYLFRLSLLLNVQMMMTGNLLMFRQRHQLRQLLPAHRGAVDAAGAKAAPLR
jgi:hypothetical protein